RIPTRSTPESGAAGKSFCNEAAAVTLKTAPVRAAATVILKQDRCRADRMANDGKAAEFAHSSGFVIRISFVIRHSDFVILCAAVFCNERSITEGRPTSIGH